MHIPRNRPVVYSRDAIINFLSENYPEIDWNNLREILPPFVARARWNVLARELGLPYTTRTLANLDFAGRGPKFFERQTAQTEETYGG